MIKQQLTECDKEPIHLAGSIQPVGFFIIIDKSSFTLLSITGDAPFSQTHKHLFTIWPEIETYILKIDIESINNTTMGFNEKIYSVRTHTVEDFLILEGMPYDGYWKSNVDIISAMYSIFTNNTKQLTNNLCKFIRELTQYDRVLLYKFIDNGHGKVIGEDKREDLASYMNHYFPASDIPVQARALYVKNRVRFIANVHHQTLPIEQNFAAIDMSNSILRAVSPIHIEYLKNMKVYASMSISIVVDDQLWGLIACHNLSEKIISFENMQILDLISHTCSREFLRIENETFYKEKEQIDYKLKQLFGDIEYKDTNVKFYKKIPLLLKNIISIFECDNVIIEFEEEIVSANLLDEELAKTLVQKIGSKGFISISSLENDSDLVQRFPKQVAGVMGIRFGDKNQYSFILIRKELSETIQWAGKPAKDFTSGTVSPRESFESWEEIQKNQAKPWSKAYKEVCKNQLLRQLNRVFLEDNTIDPMSLIKNSEACMLVTDPNLKDNPIIMINDAFTKLYGYSKDEVLGKNPRLLHQNLVNKENSKKYHNALKNEESLSILTQNKTKKGDDIWVMNNISPIFNNIGKLKYYISSQYDIAHIKQTDIQNNADKNFMEDIINTQESILIVSDGKSLLYANHTLLSFFGFDSIESFTQKYQCICELFIQNDLYYYTGKNDDDRAWIYQMLDLPIDQRIVAMLSVDKETHLFNVVISKHSDSKFIITFNDISTHLLKNQEHVSALASVVLQSDDIVVVKDLDMRVIATNDTFAKVIGKESYKEVLGKTDAEIFGVPETREPIKSYMEDERKAQKLKKGEKITTLEPVVYKDGTIKQFYTKKYPIYNDNDELIATGNISVDVTERVKLEEELKQINESLNERVEQEVNNRISSEQKYKTILESASDGIHIIDENGNIVEFSKSFAKNLGYSKEEIVKLNITDWNKNYTYETFKQKIKEISRKPRTYETVHTRKDGTTYDAQISSNWIEIDNKSYLYASARDITQLKKLETEKKRINSSLQLSQEVGAIGAWDWDILNNTLWWSDYMYTLFGYENKSDFKGDYDSFIKKVVQEDRDEVARQVELALKNEKAFDMDYRVISTDDEIIIANAKGKVIFNENGEAIRMLGTVQNVNTQRVNELKIQELNETLSLKVDEQVESIRHKDQMLQQQSKVAAMGEMVGAIAHQWRQPLNQLGIAIQNLEFDYEDNMIDDDYIESFVQRNNETITFMSSTIDDFRNFFRTDKIKERFSVKDAVVSTLGILNAQLIHYDIKTSIDGKDFILNDTVTQLQQVILNIINNAKDAIIDKHISQGMITITLDDKKTIKITDNAGGIPKDVIERIFEPYYTTKDQGKGTGMGLYMSKMIIENNMGCKLFVDNNDKGAVFIIDLSVMESDNG